MKIENFFTAGKLGNGLALFIGLLMVFAFAPFNIYPLAILLPAVLFGLWYGLTPKQAFWRGWLFGLGLFGGGVYWVFISIHTYGNASVFLAGLFTIGLVAILAFFPALTGSLTTLFRCSTKTKILYVFPATWVLLEWVRSWVFTGFPWLTLGYTQTTSFLAGYAAIVGVFGISFIVLFCGSLLIQIYLNAKEKKYRTCLYYLFAFIFIWIGGAYLNTQSWTTNFESPVTVSLVQGNIPQQMKWAPESIQPTLDSYRNMTESHWDSRIIIWPESAIPLPLQYAEGFVTYLDMTAKKHHATLMLGVPVHVPNTQNYFNAIITLGNGSGYYLKHRLVPFGEYIPFSPWLNKILDVLHIPMSDFIAAKEFSNPLIADHLKISAFICYEIAFPEMVLSRDASINMLLTVSNDAWFGESIAQAQHLQMAQMRALESQRPVLFVSNNGITAIIAANGKINAAPPYVSYVLTGTVQPKQGLTPWQRIGMDPILFALTLMIILAIREQRALKKKISTQTTHKELKNGRTIQPPNN